MTSANSPVTRILADFLCQYQWADMPEALRHEARRALLNWTACALGGCRDEAIERSIVALSPFSGSRRASCCISGCAMDAAVAALRSRVVVEKDETLAVEAASASLFAAEGRRFNAHVAQALGSSTRPMGDAALEKKFRELAAMGLPGLAAPQVIELLWRIDTLDDVSVLTDLLVPS